MASTLLRKEVLTAFKKLHRTRQKVFREDIPVLTAAREKINEEFRKNTNVTDKAAIKELVEFANSVEHEMRTTIIQTVEVSPGRYAARITEDTAKLDNVEFDMSKVLEAETSKGTSPCCQNIDEKLK